MHRLDLCLEPAPAPCLAAKFEALVRLLECTLLLSEQLTSALSLHRLLRSLNLSSATVDASYL